MKNITLPNEEILIGSQFRGIKYKVIIFINALYRSCVSFSFLDIPIPPGIPFGYSSLAGFISGLLAQLFYDSKGYFSPLLLAKPSEAKKWARKSSGYR